MHFTLQAVQIIFCGCDFSLHTHNSGREKAWGRHTWAHMRARTQRTGTRTHMLPLVSAASHGRKAPRSAPLIRLQIAELARTAAPFGKGGNKKQQKLQHQSPPFFNGIILCFGTALSPLPTSVDWHFGLNFNMDLAALWAINMLFEMNAQLSNCPSASVCERERPFVWLCLRFTPSTWQKRILVLNPGRNKAERKCLKKGRNVGKGCEVKRPRFYFTRLGGEIVVALGGHFVFCHRVWSFSILWTSEPSSWQFEGDRVIIT